MTSEHVQYLPDLCKTKNQFLLVLMTELLVLVVILADPNRIHNLWQDLGVTSLFVQWQVLLSAALLCQLRKKLVNKSASYVFTCAISVVNAVCILVSVGAIVVKQHYFQETSAFLQEGFFILRNLVVTTIIATGLFRYSYVQAQWKMNVQAELQARIQALQARIRPHFLFNSMNTIATLISTDPELAERVVEELSDLFRASLADTDTRISLAKEISLCQRYLHIESLRLGKRLSVDWQESDAQQSVFIPPLLLQPLFENAIYHGIQPIAEGGCVCVRVDSLENSVRITIDNPVAQAHVAYETTGQHLALDNIKDRLKAMYGHRASFKNYQAGNRYHVEVELPYAASEGAC